MLLNNILRQKPPGFVSVPPDMRISGVVAVLAEKSIGAVLVVEGGRLTGILSERDIVRALARAAGRALDMSAADLMTRNPTTATPGTSVEEAMEMMTDGHFRHLPIMENGILTGLVSIGDVVKARIDQSEHEVETLRTYVAGSV